MAFEMESSSSMPLLEKTRLENDFANCSSFLKFSCWIKLFRISFARSKCCCCSEPDCGSGSLDSSWISRCRFWSLDSDLR